MSGVTGALLSTAANIAEEQPPEPMSAALKGQCPKCGASGLYAGLAGFAPECRQCGLDYSSFNVGDGPAAFLTMIIGTVLVILALVLEQGLHPPVWVHIILWPLIGAAMTIALLRITKGWLLATEYRRGAEEARNKP